MDIEKAIKFPFSAPDGLVKLIIGAVLNLIPIVNLLSMGYLIQLMNGVIQGREEMPAWEDWGDKFVKGLLAAVISFIYFFIPMMVMMIGGGMAFLKAEFSLMAILGLLLILAAWFILPMALAHYAASGNFSDAFSFSSILGLISTNLGAYLGVYVLSIVLFFVLGIIGMIPILGWIILMLGGFYIGCVTMYLFAGVYRSGSTSSQY